MTSYSSVESAIEALRNGAVDYIIKPFDNDEFLHAVERALNERRIRRENALLKRSLRNAYADRRHHRRDGPGIKRVLELVRKVAPSDANVLIRARAAPARSWSRARIHRASRRADGPFVADQLRARFPRELLESELFGHVKGAFTGATDAHRGADPRGARRHAVPRRDLRARAGAAGEAAARAPGPAVRPVGGGKHDVPRRRALRRRHQPRPRASSWSGGEFREDLYYRLNVIGIHVPPLRERGDDVAAARPALRRGLRPQARQDASAGIGPDLAAFLERHPWPGNVRELENLIERAVILADVRHPRPAAELSDGCRAAGSRSQRVARAESAPLVRSRSTSASVIERFQDAHSETELARMLGIGRKALWMRRREWGLRAAARAHAAARLAPLFRAGTSAGFVSKRAPAAACPAGPANSRGRRRCAAQDLLQQVTFSPAFQNTPGGHRWPRSLPRPDAQEGHHPVAGGEDEEGRADRAARGVRLRDRDHRRPGRHRHPVRLATPAAWCCSATRPPPRCRSRK